MTFLLVLVLGVVVARLWNHLSGLESQASNLASRLESLERWQSAALTRSLASGAKPAAQAPFAAPPAAAPPAAAPSLSTPPPMRVGPHAPIAAPWPEAPSRDALEARIGSR